MRDFFKNRVGFFSEVNEEIHTAVKFLSLIGGSGVALLLLDIIALMILEDSSLKETKRQLMPVIVIFSVFGFIFVSYAIKKFIDGIKKADTVIEKFKREMEIGENFYRESPVAIVFLDKEGKIVRANSFTATISGYDINELHSLSVFELFEEAEDLLRETSEFYSNKGKETFLISKNDFKKRILVKISKTIFENEDYYQLIFVDITEEYKLKQQFEEVYKVITIANKIARSGGFKYLVDEDIIITTEEVVSLLGLPTKSVYRMKDFLDAIDERDRPSFQLRLETLKNNKDSFEIDFQLKRKTDGKRLFIRQISELEILPDGKKIIWSAFHDISEIQRQKELLQKNEEKYRIMLSLTSVGIALIDASEAYEKFLEFFPERQTPEELRNLTNDEIIQIFSNIKVVEHNNIFAKFFKGNDSLIYTFNYASIIHPDDLHKLIEMFYETFASDQAKEELIRVISPFENNKIYHSLVRLKKFEQGEKKYFVVSGTDFTEFIEAQNKIKATNKLLYNFLDSIPFIVVSLNAEGEVIFINEKGSEILGENRAEIIGKNWFENYLNERERSRLRKTFRKVLQGDSAEFPNGSNYIGTKSGERVIYWYNEIIFDTENKPSGTLSLGIDITDEQRTKKDLNKSYKELVLLKHKFERNNRKLRQMKAMLEEREKLLENEIEEKNKLFSVIAHDIRSPFTGLLASLQLLIETFDILTDEERTGIMQNAYEASIKIYNFIDMLLQWAKVRLVGFEPHPRPLKARELIDDIISLYTLQIRRKRIEISNNLSKDICLYADEFLLSGIIRNLLSNSVKFTPKNGKIIITGEEQSDKYIIKIHDTGIGMPDEIIDEIFNLDSFKPALPRPGTENEKGTGIGLLLVKEFIKKINAKIYAESKEGEGTIFTLILNKSNRCEE